MTTQLPGQLDLLDLLASEESRLAEGRAYIATEMARRPDEARTLTCPWCGYTATWTANCMDTFHCWKENDPVEEPGVCLSMWLIRNHVRYALAHESKKSIQETITRAYESWGGRAREFIPPEHRVIIPNPCNETANA